MRKHEAGYDHVYMLHHLDAESAAARALRNATAYDREKARGATFGWVNGWERPTYFGRLGAPEDFDEKARSVRR